MKKQNNIDLEGEIWKEHHIGIMVSNMGRVWTKYKGKHYGSKGSTTYLKVKWKEKTHQVHRLICETFHDNPHNYKEVDHIDRNPLNNRIENLRWADHSMQMKNREVDYKAIGEKNAEKFSIPILQLNRETLEVIKEWSSAHQAEREGGFDNAHINKCCKGRKKTHGGYVWKYKEKIS